MTSTLEELSAVAEKIKVLFIVHHPIEDSSARDRVYRFLPMLQDQGFQCKVRPFSNQALFQAIRKNGPWYVKVPHTLFCTVRRLLDLKVVGDYDLVLIHREAFPFLMPWMERKIIQRNPNVIFSLDDAIWTGHDLSSKNYSWMYRFKYGKKVDYVMSHSKLVIAGNKTIASHVEALNPNVVIAPTVIDTSYYTFREPQEPEDGTVTIGWYGSNTTSPYLKDIVPALQRLAEAHPDKVRFRFYGDPDLRLPLPNFEAFPFRMNHEIDDLRSFDIGLIPLPDTPWTRAKCAFKAILYMGVGATAVVSPIGMSAEVVTDEVNGLHATSVEDWFMQLDRLVRDVNLRRRLAISAKQTVDKRYSLQGWGLTFAEYLRSVYEHRQLTARGLSAPLGDTRPTSQETAA